METIAVIYVHAHGMRKRLQALDIPDGMKLQLFPILVQERNLASAFQRTMQQSQARYKVYISEEIKILRRGLLVDLVAAFQQHPEIGLLGVSGTKQVLTSGFTYLSPQRCGLVLDAAGGILSGTAVKGTCEAVQAIDSYLLATQRDVDWRSDILQSSIFLGPSASCEYRRAGYKVAVLAEEVPTCQLLDDALSVDGREQAAFLDEYSKDLYPLVSIIIPTYQRREYFRQALASATGQTYRNLDIFVTDNSHNEETKRVYERYFADDPRVKYEWHPEYQDAMENWHRANTYDNPKATYVNWLMDDDLFHPEKIAKMMDMFFQNPDVVLVTSYRKLIDADGKELPDTFWSKSPFQVTTRVSGDEMGRAMLTNILNIVGEPTTAIIKKSALYQNHMGGHGQTKHYQISDFPTWLYALSKGDVIYMVEPLSFFRQHPGQQQKDVSVYAIGMICWGLMMREALSHNLFLHTQEDRRGAIVRWLEIATRNFHRILTDTPDVWGQLYWKDFLHIYAVMAEALSNGYQLSFNLRQMH